MRKNPEGAAKSGRNVWGCFVLWVLAFAALVMALVIFGCASFQQTVSSRPSPPGDGIATTAKGVDPHFA